MDRKNLLFAEYYEDDQPKDDSVGGKRRNLRKDEKSEQYFSPKTSVEQTKLKTWR
jgi:hypothetical protein